jgi:DNA processing protein
VASDAWLALLQASAPGQRRWLRALRSAGSAEALVDLAPPALQSLRLPAEALARLRRPDQTLVRRWRQWLERANHALITIDSPGYPPQLSELVDAPLALWVDGPTPQLLAEPQLAIVGSRNPTAGGRNAATAFARELAEAGLVVTSGLATGIDGASHAGALAASTSSTETTIAVLGCGIDRIYPRSNRGLAAEITAGRGLLVSEYPPGTATRPHQFPQRNRIIAGLALGTLVVEATARSGSLITAQLATDYGREVFAMPGSIRNPLTRGCHALIRDGATLVESVADVLTELGALIGLDARRQPDHNSAPADALERDPQYAQLLDLIGFEPFRIADIIGKVGLTAAELSSMLLLLEMDGALEALPGARYCRSVK